MSGLSAIRHSGGLSRDNRGTPRDQRSTATRHTHNSQVESTPHTNGAASNDPATHCGRGGLRDAVCGRANSGHSGSSTNVSSKRGINAEVTNAQHASTRVGHDYRRTVQHPISQNNAARAEMNKKPLTTSAAAKTAHKSKVLAKGATVELPVTGLRRRRTSLELQLDNAALKHQELMKENEELRKLLQRADTSDNSSMPSTRSVVERQCTDNWAVSVNTADVRTTGAHTTGAEDNYDAKNNISGNIRTGTSVDTASLNSSKMLSGTNAFDMASVLELREKEVENDALRGIEKDDRTQLYLHLEALLNSCKETATKDVSVDTLLREKSSLIEFVTHLMKDLKVMEQEKSKTAMESFQMEVILRKTVAELSEKCHAMEVEAKAIQMRASVASNEFDALRSHLDSVGFHIEEALRSINANGSANGTTAVNNAIVADLRSRNRYSYAVADDSSYVEDRYRGYSGESGDEEGHSDIIESDSYCTGDDDVCDDVDRGDSLDCMRDTEYYAGAYGRGGGVECVGGQAEAGAYATSAGYGGAADRHMHPVSPAGRMSKYNPHNDYQKGVSSIDSATLDEYCTAGVGRGDDRHFHNMGGGNHFNRNRQARSLNGDVMQELWNYEEDRVESPTSSHMVGKAMRHARGSKKTEYSFVSRCFELIVATRQRLNEAATVGEVTNLQVQFENQLKNLNQGEALPPKL